MQLTAPARINVHGNFRKRAMKRLSKIILLLIIIACGKQENSIQLLYYGHSCFEVNYTNMRILIDPFTPEWFDYKMPSGKFDIVLSSHRAQDHAYFEGLEAVKIYKATGDSDAFQTIEGADTSMVKGTVHVESGDNVLSFWTVPSFHDDVQGQKNGVNGILCLNFSGIKVVHLGDIGHVLLDDQLKKIGNVDILMVPVDSYYIIDLEKAKTIVEQFSPTIVLPIHYKTKLTHNEAYIDDIDKFTKMFDSVKKIDSSILSINDKSLKVESHLLIMNYVDKN